MSGHGTVGRRLVSQPVQPDDGRAARRERNREAVVEALLELYLEGQVHPSTEVVARRAGVSSRSIFRYFDDTDDLAQAAVAHQSEVHAELRVLDVDGDLPLDERIRRFVGHRVDLLDAIGAVGLAARVHAPVHPVIRARLDDNRRRLRQQIVDVFAPELARLEPSVRGARLAVLDVVCSWESYWLMTSDQDLDTDEVGVAMGNAIERLLADAVAT